MSVLFTAKQWNKIGLAALLALTFAYGLSPKQETTEQRPLNDRTRHEALALRRSLRSPLIPVRVSERDLRELSRIPDPESFRAFRDVLLQPNNYPAPVRWAAARALSEFHGVSDEAESRLVREALGHETVREVALALADTLHTKSPAHSRYLARHLSSRAKIFE